MIVCVVCGWCDDETMITRGYFSVQGYYVYAKVMQIAEHSDRHTEMETRTVCTLLHSSKGSTKHNRGEAHHFRLHPSIFIRNFRINPAHSTRQAGGPIRTPMTSAY